jgi:hypothetical protein
MVMAGDEIDERLLVARTEAFEELGVWVGGQSHNGASVAGA